MKISELVIQTEPFITKPLKLENLSNDIVRVDFADITEFMKWMKINKNCIKWRGM